VRTNELRELVIAYLGGRCNYCEATKHLEIHHTIPLYAGGRNDMGNVELACNSCHKKLHAQLIKMYPAAEQSNKLSRRVVGANVEMDEADKAEAAEAIRPLVETGIISKDSLPDELKVLV